MKTALRVLALVLICNAVLFPQGRNYGRSMVITQQGIAATSQTLASQAGAQILTHGGSAVDAGIAANAVLCVTEPMMDGLGGDLFVIYWDAATGKLTGLNASGPAPPFELGVLAQKGSLYVTRPTLATYTATRADLEATAGELFEMVLSGRVRVDVRHTYALRDAPQVHRDLEGRKTTGSIVMLP